MVIAFDISYIQRSRAGIGRFASELLAASLSADRENRYILHGWSYGIDLEAVRSQCAGREMLKIARIPGFVRRAYWDRLQFPRLQAILGHFDLFLSMEPFLPPIGNARGVVTVHDLVSKRHPTWFTRAVLRRERWMTRSLARADAVLVPSLATKADLMEICNVEEHKICVFRPSVSPIFTSKGDPGADVAMLKSLGVSGEFMLNVGTLEPRKNIVGLVAAFERHHKECASDLRLVLVGKKGWLYEGALRAIESSPVHGRIGVLDHVSDTGLAALYRKALFVVYPSLFEGHGFPVVEAMACSTPVITSNTSSLREIGEGVAILVDPTRTDELSNAITELYGDPSRRRALSEAGVVRAREFSREQAGRSLLSLYHTLAG